MIPLPHLDVEALRNGPLDVFFETCCEYTINEYRLLRKNPHAQAFLKAEGVDFANISAIGAVRWIQLGYWNASARVYEYREVEEQLEVLGLSGNCSNKEGEPFLHLHVILGRRDFSLLGGHLKEARVHPTLEVWVRAEAATAQRRQDEATGLYLLDLPGRFDMGDGC